MQSAFFTLASGICLIMWLSQSALVMAANKTTAKQRVRDDKKLEENCLPCLHFNTSLSNVSATMPWLYDQSTRFLLKYFDDRGYGVYQATVDSRVYFLHFYDEGDLFDGFWVVNDAPGLYIEEEGRLFVSNTEYDKCPEDVFNNWKYFSKGNDWVYSKSISLLPCIPKGLFEKAVDAIKETLGLDS